MKRCIKNKKALSPVIASVLMVLLVIVLAGMVFLWARGFISEQVEKFGKPIDQQCREVSFDVVEVKRTNSLEIVNRGNIDIHNFDIKLSKRGNSEYHKFGFHVYSGEAVSEKVSLKLGDGTSPDEITIYPVLLGNVVGETSNKAFTCLDQGVKLL